MNIVRDKQAKLVNALIRATQQGKINWEPGNEESGSDSVRVSISGKTVFLSDYYADSSHSIRAEIYSDGKLAESFLDDDLSVSDVESVTSQGWYTTMETLFEMAKRNASSADEVLDSLLKDLEG